MQKQDIFVDEEYRKLLVMCLYKCPYGITTFALESHMANATMNLSHSMSAVFDDEIIANTIDTLVEVDDYDAGIY